MIHSGKMGSDEGLPTTVRLPSSAGIDPTKLLLATEKVSSARVVEMACSIRPFGLQNTKLT